MLYRILTENKQRQRVENIVSREFDAFTLYTGTGHWNGGKERSLIIEIDADAIKGDAVRNLALEIKALNEQEAVLVQRLPVVSILY
jgi:hypothetical protein